MRIGRSMVECRSFIGGRWLHGGETVEVRSPYDGQTVALVTTARASDLEDSIRAAQSAFASTRALPTWERARILEAIAAGIDRRRDELVRALALEAGKPVKAGRAEVDRAIFTFRVAAEETKRIGGEIFPLDWAPFGADRIGIVRRFPIGPIAAITPFNFPLNLCAHKIAPCLASGNTMVLKPASQAPSVALTLAELAHDAGTPPGALNVILAPGSAVEPLVSDERLRMLTFTGSASVGWEPKSKAGKKKVALELGGNAAAIVHHDADTERAAERITVGGYSYSGQSCISVQRVLVHRGILDRFLQAFVPKVEALKVGDPLDESTDVGPLITEADARRAARWVEEAVQGGAQLVLGGKREGPLMWPTIVTGVGREMKISCQEVFAPVVAVTAYDELDQALEMVNDSRYGLQAGLFSRDAPAVWKAFERLDVGGLMVDDVPTFRIDHMPYGGVKDSGLGREGVRYAIEEMTEMKILGWHLGRPGA